MTRRSRLIVCSLAAAVTLLATLNGGAGAMTVLPGEGGVTAPTRSWAAPYIQIVTAHGLMGGDASTFRPDAALTSSALARLVGGLTRKPIAQAVDPARPVSMAELDAALVRGLGLADVAAAFTTAAQTAGLSPPTRFGTEAVARLLGLRVNHPAAQDSLELRPQDVATRAEAAYSAARILAVSGREVLAVRLAASSFVLPSLTAWERRILSIAVHLIGYPYVWGGTNENAEAPFGVPARGGFDCSGFVWRVYKLEHYAGSPQLSGVLRGRTTYQMSGEVPRSRRLTFPQLQPADVVFFGTHGTRSQPAEVGHMGIYLGAGWMIHSSSEGVALTPLAGWYRTRFAWARRPLAEAGLR